MRNLTVIRVLHFRFDIAMSDFLRVIKSECLKPRLPSTSNASVSRHQQNLATQTTWWQSSNITVQPLLGNKSAQSEHLLPPAFCDFVGPLEFEVTVPSQDAVDFSNDRCANCELPFPKRKKSSIMHRFRLSSLKVTDPVLLNRGEFVCPKCRCFLIRKKPSSTCPPSTNLPKESHAPLLTRYAQECKDVHLSGTPSRNRLCTASSKRTPSCLAKSPRRVVSSPICKKPKLCPRSVNSSTSHVPRCTTGHAKRITFKQPTIESIERSKYKRALTFMMKAPNRAVQKAFFDLIRSTIRKEVAAYSKNAAANSPVTQAISLGALENFRWATAISEMRKEMPLAVCVSVANRMA